MIKTVRLQEETWKKLVRYKLDKNKRNMNEVVEELLNK